MKIKSGRILSMLLALAMVLTMLIAIPPPKASAAEYSPSSASVVNLNQSCEGNSVTDWSNHWWYSWYWGSTTLYIKSDVTIVGSWQDVNRSLNIHCDNPGIKVTWMAEFDNGTYPGSNIIFSGNDCTFEMIDGYIKNNSISGSWPSPAIIGSAGTNITISGGSVTSRFRAIASAGGNITVAGGIVRTVNDLGWGYTIDNPTGSVSLYAGEVSSDQGGTIDADHVYVGDVGPVIVGKNTDSQQLIRVRNGITVNNGDLTVYGSVLGYSGNGIMADNNSSVYISRNISAGNGIGVVASGGSTVTVDGTVTAQSYVQTGAAAKTIEDVTVPSTKPLYATYTDNISTVWVKAVTPKITNGAYFTCVTGTGGNFSLTATGTLPVAWSVSGAPAGVSVSGDSLVVAPSVPEGVYSFTITATNEAATPVSQGFTLTVQEVGGTGIQNFDVFIELSDTGDDIRNKIIAAMMKTRSGDTVTVTGRTTLTPSTPIEVRIYEGVRVIWKAPIAGRGSAVLNLTDVYTRPSGIFEVAEGADIYLINSTGTAILNEADHHIIVSDGAVIRSDRGAGTGGWSGNAISFMWQESTGDITINGGEIRCFNQAIYARNSETVITINGGIIDCRYRDGWDPWNRAAIQSPGPVYINGGLVFAHASRAINGAVIAGSGGTQVHHNGGVILAWDANSAGNSTNSTYPKGSSYDLDIVGGTARWWMTEGRRGLYYTPTGSPEELYFDGVRAYLSKSEDSLLERIEIDTSYVKTRYAVGDELDLSRLYGITAVYDDGFSDYIYDYDTDPADGTVLDTAGTVQVTVSYTEDSVTRTAAFDVNVYEPVLLFEYNGEQYYTLDDVFWAMEDEPTATIKLLRDADCYDEWLSIYDQNVTFDLNGFTLRLMEGLTLSSSSVGYTGTGGFEIYKSLQLDESNIAFTYYEGDSEGGGEGGGFKAQYGSVAVLNGDARGGAPGSPLISCEDSLVTINGSVTADNGGGIEVRGGWSEYASSSVTVNGNVSVMDEDGYELAIMFQGAGTVTVYGDVYSTGPGVEFYYQDAVVNIYGNLKTGSDAIYASEGTINVSGGVWGIVNAMYGATAKIGGSVYNIGNEENGEDGGEESGGGFASIMALSSEVDPDPYDAAVYVSGSSVDIGKSIFSDSGLGLWAQDDADVSVGGSIFAGDGVGVYADTDTDITVTGNIYASMGIVGEGVVVVLGEAPEFDSIEIAVLPRLDYVAGDPLDLTGLVVNKVFSDDTREDVTDSITADPPHGAVLNSVGSIEVTVSYTENGDTITAAFYVEVFAPGEVSEGVIVSGSVKSYDPNNPTTIQLLQGAVDGEGGTVVYTATIPAESGSGECVQTYSFTDVAPGTYTLKITKSGHLSYTKLTFEVGDSGETIDEIALITGDINGDGAIEAADFLLFRNDYGKSGSSIPGDLNGDGTVDAADFLIFRNGYGKSNVVEP